MNLVIWCIPRYPRIDLSAVLGLSEENRRPLYSIIPVLFLGLLEGILGS